RDNTVLKKKYPGGMLTMTGSNSPANLASTPSRYVFGDEIDRWTTDAGGEGDPWALLEARTTTFFNHKMVQVSTPTIKGFSAIESSFALGTQEYWSAECPHCKEYSFVEFDNIRFEHETKQVGSKKHFLVKKVQYCCPKCGCISSESKIKRAKHKWVAKNPDAYKNGVRSFWINAFSSPWTAWAKIILRFLEADGDPNKLKVVFNTLLGQLWEDRGKLRTDDQMLEIRESYKAELPDGVLCLTCGVDTQDNRLEYEVVGHGFFKETWGIEKGIIVGKPDAEDTPEMESVWTRLDRVIDKRWSYENGKQLKISITFVDSGGHYTQEVYQQCMKRINKRVFAIKGKGGEGIPFTSPPSKVNIIKEDDQGNKYVIGKAWLYTIGVDSGKEKIMSALEVNEPGARYCHYPIQEEKGYDSNYFNGLLSERMTYKGGKWKWEKLPGHIRNEPLDCRNYANAAFRVLNPNLDQIAKKLKEMENGETEVKNKPAKKVLRKQRKRNIQKDDW
ncbi:phage terminase large subunit family protein, partial [Lachnotalea glycerini]